MEPAWLTRLRDEQRDLADKVSKLRVFVGTEAFKQTTVIQQRLLRIQLVAMATYLEAVSQRLEDILGTFVG